MTQKEMMASESLARQMLPIDDRTATQTSWQDPWRATQEARAELATKRPEALLGDPRGIGHRISREINRDPEEVRRLRKAREEARHGRTSPPRNDT